MSISPLFDFVETPATPCQASFPGNNSCWYEHIFHYSGDAILLFNEQGKIQTANPTACRLLGYEQAELLQTRNTDLLDPSILENLTMPNVLENLPTPQRHQVKFRHKTGSLIPAEISCSFFTDQGHIYRLCMIRDLRPRFQDEQNRSQEERFRFIGHVASSIGHEIRNPLTTVRGFLQWLSHRPSSADHRNHFQLMLDELDQANRVISEFVSLAESRTAQTTAVDINAIIRNLVSDLVHVSPFPGQTIKLALQPLSLIRGDEKELRHLFLHIIQNSLEAMSHGGIVHISSQPSGSSIQVEIADQGSGIPPHILDKLGTPFLSTKEKAGLGIAVCQSIVFRHQAAMSFRSNAGGTVVTLEFPSPICTDTY